MGYYLQTGKNMNKAKDLVAKYGGVIFEAGKNTREDLLEVLHSPTKALVCVVDNRIFEAAAYIYNEQEFEAFWGVSDRNKQWICLNKLDQVMVDSDYNKNAGKKTVQYGDAL